MKKKDKYYKLCHYFEPVLGVINLQKKNIKFIFILGKNLLNFSARFCLYTKYENIRNYWKIMYCIYYIVTTKINLFVICILHECLCSYFCFKALRVFIDKIEKKNEFVIQDNLILLFIIKNWVNGRIQSCWFLRIFTYTDRN